MTPNLKYAALSFPNSNSITTPGIEMEDYRNRRNYTGASGVTTNTETTMICMTPTGELGEY